MFRRFVVYKTQLILKIMKTEIIKQIQENQQKIKSLLCNQYGTPVDMEYANSLYDIEDELMNQLNN